MAMALALQDARLCIVGLGLMGGSLAMALRGRVRQVVAQDIDRAVLNAAIRQGVIDEIGPPDEADIVVLAVPVGRMLNLIPNLELRPGALVIDLGSTKSRVCEALDRLPEQVIAVGGHPLCGLAENGFQNAIPTLYHGARFVLCETARTTPDARSLAESLVVACGAQVLWMERERHDALTALTSHVPHLLNFALMRLAMEVAADEPALYELAAGGFDGATRLARTAEPMITGMFTTNAAHIREMTTRLRAHLDELEVLLDDPAHLPDALRPVVEARRQYTTHYQERLIT